MKKDSIVCAVIALTVIALSSAAIIAGRILHSDDHTAYIYLNGELDRTIELDEVDEPYAFMIGDVNTQYNIISVRRGEIGVISASCPDKLCMEYGYIKPSDPPIVCLPNRLVIKIGSKNTDME